MLLLRCMVKLKQVENSRPVVVVDMSAVSAERHKCPSAKLSFDYRPNRNVSGSLRKDRDSFTRIGGVMLHHLLAQTRDRKFFFDLKLRRDQAWNIDNSFMYASSCKRGIRRADDRCLRSTLRAYTAHVQSIHAEL